MVFGETDVLDHGPFYHGTKADLQVGDLLTAGFKSNYKPEIIMNHIYFTSLANGAGLAAALAEGDGRERVYIVEPIGSFENDPNVTDKKFPPKIYKSSGLLLKIASKSLGRRILGIVPMVRKYQKIYRKLFSEELKNWPIEIKGKLINDHESIQWLLSGSRETANVDDLYEEIRNAKVIPNIPTTILCSMEIDDFRRVVLAGETDELITKEIEGKKRLYQEYLSSLTEGKLIELKSGHVNMPFRYADTIASAIKEMQNRFSKIQ